MYGGNRDHGILIYGDLPTRLTKLNSHLKEISVLNPASLRAREIRAVNTPRLFNQI